MSVTATAGRTNSTLQGAAFMVSGMAIIGLIDNYVVHIAAEAGLWQFHLLRSVLACGLVMLGALIFGWRLRPKQWRGVAIRSFCAAFSMLIYFGALAYVPIAQVGAGLFTAPIFVLIFSVLFFGQPVGWVRIFAAVCGFLGVLLVLQPNPSALQLITVLPMFAGITWGIAALSTRHLCAEEETVTLLFWFFGTLGAFGAIGLLVTGLGFGDGTSFFGRGWVAPTYDFWYWTAIQALGSLVAVGCLTRAYQVGDPSYVAPFEYSFLIFAIYWGWNMFGDLPGLMGWIGLGLIVLSGVVIALRSGDASP
ncbi:MAG: DMT family transporter [Pseudomonadota bacterium]